MKTIEIVSWRKRRTECGISLQLVSHPTVFAFESGISFEYDETAEVLSVRIEKYSDDVDYTNNERKVIGEDKSRADKCVIVGKREHIKEMQHFSGYNSIGLRNELEPLAETIDDLSREISSLRFEIQELHEKLQTTRKYEQEEV